MKIINQITQKALDRADQWKTVLINTLPDPYLLKETTILGSYSYTLLSNRIRLISKPDSIKLNTDFDSPILKKPIFETPSAIARDYLKIKYKRSPIIKHTQANSLRDGLNMSPNYAKPSTFAYGFYIDIKSAYWSIMESIGWNVDYYPNQWLSAGTPPLDFPFPNHKIARNCLVSSGYTKNILQYQPRGVFNEIKMGNQLANVSLYRLINDILNSIAAQAILFGAVYVNTDGFIAPNRKVAVKIIHLIKDWGLTPSVKAEGKGGIKSSGAYKVGNVISAPYKLRTDSTFIKNVNPPKYASWLQKNFAFWVRENT